jgi:hypothetical protein
MHWGSGPHFDSMNSRSPLAIANGTSRRKRGLVVCKVNFPITPLIHRTEPK